MARHNTNHKGKAQDCYLCATEAAVDKAKKKVLKSGKTKKRTSIS